MILHVCEDGDDDAQRMFDQRAATETFDENRTLLNTTTKQQQTMKRGPPCRLFIHTYTHALNHARTVAHSSTPKHTHVTFITVYIQYKHALMQT